jgi:enoyl-CoA hydratase
VSAEREGVDVEVAVEGVGVLTLDRPAKRNALSISLRDAIRLQLESWRDDPEVSVAVINGRGPAFCAGFDLDEFANPDLARAIRSSSVAYHHAVWSFPKPLVAAINGPALGGGFDLAVLCDIRIAAAGAAFAHPEIKFGAPPLFTPLRWIVGDGVARDLCLTGRRIDADEALSVGLVSRVVEPDRLRDEALALARGIAEAPQHTLIATKRYLVGSQGMGFDDAFRVEHDDVFDRFLSGSVGPRSDDA